MGTYVVEIGGGKDPVRFSGDMLAYVESPDNRTMLILYRTTGGKYVCEKIMHPKRDGDNDYRRTGGVCEDSGKVFTFFGTGELATQLYSMAKLERQVRDID